MPFDHFADQPGCSSNCDEIGKDRLKTSLEDRQRREMEMKRNNVDKLLQQAEAAKLLIHRPPPQGKSVFTSVKLI